MSKWKKIIGGVFVLTVATVVGLIAIISAQDFNQYKGLIAEQVQAATGRTLSIDGDLSLALSLTPTLAVEGVSFQNAGWAERSHMIEARRIEAQVSLVPLLSGVIQVDRVVLRDVNIHLTRSASGEVNWALGASDATPDAAPHDGAAKLPLVKEVDVRNLQVFWSDQQSETTKTFKLDRLDTATAGSNKPVDLALAGTMEGLPFELAGQLGSIDSITAGDTFPVDIKGDIAGIGFSLNGRIADPLQASGLSMDVSVTASDLSGLAPLTGSSLPPLRDIDIRTTVTDSQGRYQLTGLVAKLGGSHLTADAEITITGQRPKLTLDAVAKRIDLSDLIKGGENQPQTSDSQTGKIFSTDPLPFDTLDLMDAEVAIYVQELLGLPISLRELKTAVVIANGNLTLKSLQAQIGGGDIAGTMTLTRSAPQPQLSLSLDSDAIGIGAIMAEMGLSDAVSGIPLDSAIQLNGQGQSIAAIMASLNGAVRLQGGPGRVDNKAFRWAGGDFGSQLIGALNPMAAQKDMSVLSCAVVRFTVNDGLAVADKGIGMEGEALTLQGTAEINLATETIKASMTPRARKGLNISLAEIGAGLITIRGTLINPSVGVDGFGAAKAAAKVGAALATGGLSLLGSALVGDDDGDDQPCRTALGLKPVSAPAKTSPRNEPPAVQRSPSAADQLKQGLGGALKNLFGQ